MRARLRRGALILAVPSVVLAACSSPGRSAPATTTTRPARASTTTSSTTTTAPGGPIPSTLPTARTSGPLAMYASVPVPLFPAPLISTEAPDGAVFMAEATLAAQGASPPIVWVADGDSPAAIAEHLTGAANALAADATNLYVANDGTMTAFNRSTGVQSGQWSFPAPTSSAAPPSSNVEEMAASDGNVLVSVPQGNTVDVYRINVSSTAAPQLIAQGLSAAFGPGGTVVYETPDHHLVEQSATGSLTTGPLLADAPNGVGGGVQYVDTVAGGTIWVIEPAGQGLDAEYATFDLSTLKPTGSFSGTVALQVADTQAGTLALNGPGPCPQPSSGAISNMCLTRIAADGTLSDRISVGSALGLLGPYPVVLATSPGGTSVVVDRYG
jgi:hypothetical protein